MLYNRTHALAVNVVGLSVFFGLVLSLKLQIELNGIP